MRPRQVVWRARRLVPPALLALGIDRGRDGPAWRPLPHGLGVDPGAPVGRPPPPHATASSRRSGASRRFPAPDFWDDSVGRSAVPLPPPRLRGPGGLRGGGANGSGDEFWAEVVESWLAEQSRPRMPAWHPFPTSAAADLVVRRASRRQPAGRRALRDRLAREIRAPGALPPALRRARHRRQPRAEERRRARVRRHAARRRLAPERGLAAAPPRGRAAVPRRRRPRGAQHLVPPRRRARSRRRRGARCRRSGAAAWLDDAVRAGARWMECDGRARTARCRC